MAHLYTTNNWQELDLNIFHWNTSAVHEVAFKKQGMFCLSSSMIYSGASVVAG